MLKWRISWHALKRSIKSTIPWTEERGGLPSLESQRVKHDWATKHAHRRSNQFSSVAQSLRLFVTPWITARQASLSITNSQSLLKLMSIESVMPSSHLILCHPLFLLPPIPPSIRVFSNESTPHMRWPKYWWFSFSISPSNEHPGLIKIKPGNPKGNQPWIFIGRTDAEAPILWPRDAESRLTVKDPDMGKTEGKRRRGEAESKMVS